MKCIKQIFVSIFHPPTTTPHYPRFICINSDLIVVGYFYNPADHLAAFRFACAFTRTTIATSLSTAVRPHTHIRYAFLSNYWIAAAINLPTHPEIEWSTRAILRWTHSLQLATSLDMWMGGEKWAVSCTWGGWWQWSRCISCRSFIKHRELEAISRSTSSVSVSSWTKVVDLHVQRIIIPRRIFVEWWSDRMGK